VLVLQFAEEERRKNVLGRRGVDDDGKAMEKIRDSHILDGVKNAPQDLRLVGMGNDHYKQLELAIKKLGVEGKTMDDFIQDQRKGHPDIVRTGRKEL
jgi:hypothetical protein